MIPPLAFLLLTAVSAGTLVQGSGKAGVTAVYGETIVIPCSAAAATKDLVLIKWKYEKNDGSFGDLLVTQALSGSVTDLATDDFAGRVSTDNSSNLLITHASLNDQKTFTCMVVSGDNIIEIPVPVLVHKKPSSVQIMDKADALQRNKSTTVGTCVATDAHPAATITWKKNGQTLVAEGKAITITPSIKLDPGTGLSTTSSTLQYVATMEDAGAVFSCMSSHELANQEAKLEPVPLHYPTEKVSLQIMNKKPIKEGDNVTLKCQADGNPPPTSFVFNIKTKKVPVENSDTYTLVGVSRDAAGEYKCSLADNEKVESSQSMVVSYLDMSLSPSGQVVKTVGDSLSVKMEKNSSEEAPKVSWTKNGAAVKEPKFVKLTYADSGVYSCELSIPGITRRKDFELLVEGKPVITSLTKQIADGATHKVLTCEAEGVPEPSFQWSINNTNERTSYSNGRATHSIEVIPKMNLTATCTVTNRLGSDTRTINVSSIFTEEEEGKAAPVDSEDQAAGLIAGIVFGLLIAAAVVGLIYWLYMKNTRQGSWKTGEKEELGTLEEGKKLEENSHNL